MGFPFSIKILMGFGFWMCCYKDGFSLKVKFRERERERPLALSRGRGGELSGFGVDFKSSHHFVVSTNVLEALPLVFCEFLRRRHGRVERQSLRERERERAVLFGIWECQM